MSVDTDSNPMQETFQGYRLRAVALIFYSFGSLIAINRPNL